MMRDVTIWAEKPTFMEGEYIDYWSACGKSVTLEKLKLAEFENKDCQECIYEVPRKTTGNEIEQKMLAELERKLNAIVDAAIDAVNKLKRKTNDK